MSHLKGTAATLVGQAKLLPCGNVDPMLTDLFIFQEEPKPQDFM